MWIISNVVENAEGRMTLREGLSGPVPTAVYALGIGSSLLDIIGALLCLRIIRGVQERLEARRAGV